MSTKQTGILGEKIAQRYLKNKGYRILDTNYSFRISSSPQKGEMDIVAKKGDTIHFVEVKALRQAQGEHFLPEDKVDIQKQRKIIKTAESWLMKNEIPLDSKWQIDVVSIIMISSDNKKAKIRYFQNI
jgi:putative endonuclease